MSKIKIQNFGAIKNGFDQDDGWIDINKVTVFIGDQGSGKSTVAKLISTFTWIEKALVRGDYDKRWFERKNKLKNQFLGYHRLQSYMKPNSIIEYVGEAYNIKYRDNSLQISQNEKTYHLPQIMYIPSERNFIAYVKTPKELRLSSDSLKEFLVEYNLAMEQIKTLELPINGTYLEYDKLNEVSNIRGKDFKVKLTDASSGFQSLVPLYVVSSYLANRVKNLSENKEKMSGDEIMKYKRAIEEFRDSSDTTEEQFRIIISTLATKFNKSAFINIIEEPEQNLFPESQWKVLQKLLEYNNLNAANKLIITTHSPYIVNYLSIAIKAGELFRKYNNNKDIPPPRLEDIISEKSTVSASDVVIYEISNEGLITKLNASTGIPSDNNYLNQMLRKGNELFEKLLEVEDDL